MYEIRENSQYGSREVYFDNKPGGDIIVNLKSLKMRWNPKKKCWYGFAAESDLIAAINAAGEAVVTDGYLGGGAYYGANSGKYLHGAELSKAIRQAIKAAGIKGVSIRCHTYSGGQSIYATFKTTPADFVSKADYIASYEISPSRYWIWTGTEDVHVDKYFSMDGDQQKEIREAAAAAEYERSMTGVQVNQYCIDKYTEFTPDFIEKMHSVNGIIASFNFDESNSMVDYFNTNFYWHLETKAVEAA